MINNKTLTVFFSGSRSLDSRTLFRMGLHEALSSLATHRIVIGDATGADSQGQDELASFDHRQVRVYHAEGNCRNFSTKGRALGWKAIPIAAPAGCSPVSRHSLKDRVMAQIADAAVVFWDSSSIGSLCNIHAMLRQGKRVKLYRLNNSTIVGSEMLRSFADWQNLFNDLHFSERRACERRIAEMDSLLSIQHEPKKELRKNVR